MSEPASPLNLEAVAARYDVPPEAVAIVLDALRRGGGRQAQFSHPALGGMGQWSRGGGVMIGDMVNHALKAKVDDLCKDLVRLTDDAGSTGSPSASREWWPSPLGTPASVGSQNGASYAFFPDARRLLIREGSSVTHYETGEHRIVGAAQHQSTGSYDLTFTSQHGTLRLGDLRRAPPMDIDGGEDHRSGPGAASATGGGQDILGLIERLHDLQRRGIITSEEFSNKKTELLTRL